MTIPITVLLLDEDEMLRTSMKEWLHDDGFSVHCAANGSEALQILAAVRCDVAIIDLMHGTCRCEDFLLEALMHHPQTRYAICTGSQSYGLSLQLRELGMCNDDVIYKPVANLAHLTDKILSMVTRSTYGC